MRVVKGRCQDSIVSFSREAAVGSSVNKLPRMWVMGVMVGFGGLGLVSESWALCTINHNGLHASLGSECDYGPGSPHTVNKTVDGVDYTALILPGPQKAVVYASNSSVINMHGNSYFELSGGGTRNGVQMLSGSVLNVYGNLYSKTYNALNSRAVIAQGTTPAESSLIHVHGDLFAYRSGSGGSAAAEVESASRLLVEGDAHIFSDSNPSTHGFRQYGTSSFAKNLTVEIKMGADNDSTPNVALRNRGHLQVADKLTVLTQWGTGIEQTHAVTPYFPLNEISAKSLLIDTSYNTGGNPHSNPSVGNAYQLDSGKGTFGQTEINAVGSGIVFNGGSGVLNFGMGDQSLDPGPGVDALLAIGSEASIQAAKQAVVFDGPASSYTFIADGAQVAGLQGLYLGTGGNSTLELAQNAHVTGAISMGDGSDTLILHGNVDLSRVPFMDGGDDLSMTDGFVDTAVFKGFSSSISGEKLLNWEKVVIDGGSLAFSNNALTTGSDAELGLFIVNGGVQNAGAGFALQGNLHVKNDGRFQAQGDGGGLYRVSGDVYHAGVVSLDNSKPRDVFQIAGNYHGQDGTFVLDTVLGADDSATDSVLVEGDTSGTGNLQVHNRGGLGDLTVADGIRVVEVKGLSNGAFSLRGDYVRDGQPVVVGGAYAYSLHQGGKADPADGHWYLRSELTPPDPTPPVPTPPQTPAEPSYQAGVPVYEIYPQFLLGLSDLPTLQQRVGNRSWSQAGAKQLAQGLSDNTMGAVGDRLIEGTGVWGRIEGRHLKFLPRRSTSDTDYKYDSVKIQFGYDRLLSENASHRMVGGVSAHYINGNADAYSRHGDGKVKTDGYGIGATLTWYGANNVYVDNQVHYTWYDTDLSSRTAGRSLAKSNKGYGYALSTEVGKRYVLNDKWTMTPQAQLQYSRAGFDSFQDTFGAEVSKKKAHRLQARLGVSVDYQNAWLGADGKMRRNLFYGIINYHSDLLQKSKVEVSRVSISRQNERHWLGVGVGGTYNWNNDQYSLYGEVNASTALANFGKSYGVRGVVGMRVRW